jgi:hypothetical protein
VTEIQPDLLGGRDRSSRSLPRVRRRVAVKPAAAGHYATPGTGPCGETCGGCHWLETFHFKRTYHKCGARPGHHWKGGRATDIRPLDAACSHFERAANRLPPTPNAAPADTAERVAETIAELGTGSHRVGAFDILIAPTVRRPSTQGAPDVRQIDFFE